MSASAAFFCGVVVGLVVSLVVLALAKAAGVQTPWEKEEAARQQATARREQIKMEEGNKHDAVSTITPGEMDLIVAGNVTLSDVLRGRDDPRSPFFRAKPGGSDAATDHPTDPPDAAK